MSEAIGHVKLGSPSEAPYYPPEDAGLYHHESERDACGVGFIAHTKGIASRDIVTDSLQMLERMDHRGSSVDGVSGDGAGLLCRIPHSFFERVLSISRITLPPAGEYAIGMAMMPADRALRKATKDIIERIAAECNVSILTWRTVPRDSTHLGPSAQESEPYLEQLFITQKEGSSDDVGLDQKAYVLMQKSVTALEFESAKVNAKMRSRKASGGTGNTHTRECDDVDMKLDEVKYDVYWSSFSTRTIVYKGLFLSFQVERYYIDLQQLDFTSSLSLVHSRFSTNTFPSWERSQPLRTIAHNGEINTVKGNKVWMRSRHNSMSFDELGLKGEEAECLRLANGLSDSGAFDRVFNLLLSLGRTPQEIMMHMIPEAWQSDKLMAKKKRDFYEYASCIMEPWDGPAFMCFTDGRHLGATLDRSGLRPARYYELKDGRFIMAS